SCWIPRRCRCRAATIAATCARCSPRSKRSASTPHRSPCMPPRSARCRVALIAGGHDRGIAWDGFADAMRTRAPATIITVGQNGPKIHALLAPIASEAGFALLAARDLEDAVRQARDALAGEGVVLLSPGAPSFG